MAKFVAKLEKQAAHPAANNRAPRLPYFRVDAADRAAVKPAVMSRLAKTGVHAAYAYVHTYKQHQCGDVAVNGWLINDLF